MKYRPAPPAPARADLPRVERVHRTSRLDVGRAAGEDAADLQPARYGWEDAAPALHAHLHLFEERSEAASSQPRSEEDTSGLQAPCNLLFRPLLEKKKNTT